MELTGRTYIFFAATLLLLIGTLQFYEQAKEDSSDPTMVVTRADARQDCDSNAIKLSNTRIGCRYETGDSRVRELPSSRTSVTNSGAKFVSSLSNS